MHTLSSLLQRFNDPPVALVKADCEGCEWSFYRNAWPMLQRQVRYVMGAMHFKELDKEVVYASKEELDNILQPYFQGKLKWPVTSSHPWKLAPLKANGAAWNISKLRWSEARRVWVPMNLSCDVYSGSKPHLMRP